MRFLPLVWAALRRKPVRSILVFLSVTVAFTLFGLMIGLNATLELVLSRAHADRVWVGTRFDNSAFPIAVGKRVAGLPGVRDSTVMNYIPGYIGDPKNRIFVILAEFGDERDPNYPDQDTDPDTPGPTVFNGPLHNAIPQPMSP